MDGRAIGKCDVTGLSVDGNVEVGDELEVETRGGSASVDLGKETVVVDENWDD